MSLSAGGGVAKPCTSVTRCDTMNSRANEGKAELAPAMPSAAEKAGTEKYMLINQGFAGKQRLVPFFNRSNNEDLILAIQSAGVSRGLNGFRKDKSGEN